MHLRSFTFVLPILLASAFNSNAAPYVPEVLEAWQEWVLHDKPFKDCPWNGASPGRTSCAWLKFVDLNIQRGEQQTEAKFILNASVFGRTNLQLPYADDVMPQGITVDDQKSAVVTTQSGPAIPLDPGQYLIEGNLVWALNAEPAFLRLNESAFLRLQIDDEVISNARLDDGRLWLRSRQQAEVKDTLNIKVYRLLEDGAPLMLTTHLRLTADGRARTVNLGQVLPSKFVVTQIMSDLPFQLAENGEAAVQVARGTANIHFVARSTEDVSAFRYSKPNPHWSSVEYWGWQPQRDVRLVSVEGPPTVDLNQIDYPFHTDGRSGFALSEGIELQLVEEQRGNVNPYPARFDVERDLWLSFDGDSFVARDNINAQTDSETTISANYIPGKVTVNGQHRLISFSDPDESSAPGVTLAARRSHVEAVSLIERDAPLRAVGWDLDVDRLRASLNLPPGWRLLWTRGIDRVTTSWLSAWSIWDVFLAVLLIILVYRVGGLAWAAVVALGVILSYQENPVTTLGFLALAAVAALTQLVDHDGFKRFLRGSYWVLIVPIAIACIFYSTFAARQAIYPQLERSHSFQDTVATLATSQVERVTVSAPGLGEIADDEESSMARRRAFTVGAHIPERSDVSPDRIVDPATGVQIPTGPGLPEWSWRSVSFDWSGPVSKSQEISLTLLSPWMFRILSFASAALTLVVLLFFVLRQVRPDANLPQALRVLMPALALLVFVPQDTFAEIPSQRMLDELERRLLAPPDCVPECIHFESVSVDIHADDIQLQITIHAAAQVAVPLPESTNTWTHDRVTVNGEDGLAMRVGDRMHVLLDEGVHTVATQASVGEFSRIDVDYPMAAGVVRYDIEGWESIGGEAIRSLTHAFSRLEDASTSTTTTLVQDPIESYVRVTRTLHFGFEPRAHTVVTRIAPASGAFSVVVPLMSGETMLADEHTVADRNVTVDFPTDRRYASWNSRLDVAADLTLVAPPISVRQEIWTLEGSDFWNYSHSGIVPVKSGSRGTTFHPRSNEALQISLVRPKPTDGDWITVQNARLKADVGSRSTNVELQLHIEASQAADFDLSLPTGARVTNIRAADRDLPIPATGEVKLPLTAGVNDVSVSWLTDGGAKLLYSTPNVDLQQHARNINLHASFPDNRWTLLLGGPAQGAAVLFWGIALVVLVIAVGLSRLEGFPLTTPAAVFLTFGASLANLWALLFAGAWFIAIWWRNRNDLGGVESPYYAFGQLVFLMVSVLAIAVLVATVPLALLGQPDMQITGNGSNARDYFWYADYSATSLPTAWVISLPRWIYLIAMFAWSIWLAAALVNWVRLAWQAVSKPQFWPPAKKLTRKSREGLNDEPTSTETDRDET